MAKDSGLACAACGRTDVKLTHAGKEVGGVFVAGMYCASDMRKLGLGKVKKTRA